MYAVAGPEENQIPAAMPAEFYAKSPLPQIGLGCFITAPLFFMRPFSYRRAFTLLEIVVILGIIALFLALLVPFAIRAREGGRSAACVKNLQVIGKAIAAYTADNDGRLPGPLSMDQYPVDAAGNPPRDGQLLKYITSHLNSSGGARNIFTFPGWQKAQRATDSAVFLVNVDPVAPFEQPIWGDMAVKDKAPLKIEDVRLVRFRLGDKDVNADPARVWALTEADQMLARILGAGKSEAWVLRMPEKAVHVSHRNALYFDWHVDRLLLTNSSVAPPTAD
jgi:type II secretory pathway pseudopilin PulG